MRTATVRLAWTALASWLTVSPSLAAQATKPTEDENALAKKLSNPISDLVSVPFQFNWEQKVGPAELSRFILNIHPDVGPSRKIRAAIVVLLPRTRK